MSDSLWPHGPQHALLPHLLEFVQLHVHWVGDAIQPSHHWSSPSPLPSIFPSIRVFFNESALCIRWPKYWSFSISSANEYSRLIHFKIDWFDLLAVQGTLKTLGILRNVEKKIFFSMNCASKTDLIRNSEVLLEVKYWILAPFPCFNRTSSLLPI